MLAYCSTHLFSEVRRARTVRRQLFGHSRGSLCREAALVSVRGDGQGDSEHGQFRYGIPHRGAALAWVMIVRCVGARTSVFLERWPWSGDGAA